MTPENKPATVIPVFFVDELIMLPRGLVGAHEMANEAEEVAKGLGRIVRPKDGIIYSRGTPANQSELDGIKLVVLICDVDQNVDLGATVRVATTYLREISRFAKTILVVTFSSTKKQAIPSRLDNAVGLTRVCMAPMGSTPEQVHQQICIYLRN